MKWLIAPILVLVVGCGAQTPISACYGAIGTYAIAQVAIEGYVTSPAPDPALKATLQKIDREAVKAGQTCRDSAVASDEDGVAFALGVMKGAVGQSRALIGGAL